MKYNFFYIIIKYMNDGIIKDTYDFCIFLHEKMVSCIFITRELLYILLFLFLLWLVYFKNKKYIGGKKDFIIGCENGCSRVGIKYLIEKIYPDKIVSFIEEESNKKCDLIVRSTRGEFGRWNRKIVPYIYITHETYLPVKSDYHSNYLFMGIIPNRDKLVEYNKNKINENDKYLYMPDGILVYKELLDSVTNNFWKERDRTKVSVKEKKYLIGYCYKNSVIEREDLYNKFVEKTKNGDKKCIAFGRLYGKYPETRYELDETDIINKNPSRASYEGLYSSFELRDKLFNLCKFVISMENSVDVGPSEKMFYTFKCNSIPIFWGQNSDIFNKNAYIDVLDFESFEECVDYVVNMSDEKIEEMMNEYPFNKDNDYINYWTDDINDNKTLKEHCKVIKRVIEKQKYNIKLLEGGSNDIKLYSNLGEGSNFSEDVDFLIPWSGIDHSDIDDNLKVDVHRFNYNHELYYNIECIINNASWYNNIIVYLDKKEDLYSIINKDLCKKYRILAVERGKYFSKGNYPTMNICAIETTFHKIKELSEYFIYIDDDILISNKIEKGQFFSDDKRPIITHSYVHVKKKGKEMNIYFNEDVFEGVTPLTFGPCTHTPGAYRKSVCGEVAKRYSKWYSFVQSHKKRFSSSDLAKKEVWGLEEYMKGVWNYYLYKSNKGILRLLDYRKNSVLIEYFLLSKESRKEVLKNIKRNNTLFVNFNDERSVTPEETLYGMKEIVKSFGNKLNGGEGYILNNIDKVYLINLDTSSDRLENINKQNKFLKLNIIRHVAVYGKDINKKGLIEGGILSKDSKLTDGQIGCYLSHIEVLKKASDENHNIIMILEDDIIFGESFKEKLNKYYKEVPNEWDIIYLGGSRLKGKKISKHVVKGVYEKNIDGGYNMGTFAMMISKKGIKKLLSLLYPIRYAIDTTIAKNNKDLNIYMLNPSIITHNNDFKSEIKFLDENIIYNYNNDETPTKIEIVGGSEKNIINKIDNMYFINLDSSKKRLEYINEEAKRLNLNLIRYSAVYGKEVDEKKLIDSGRLDKNHKLKKGELGCCLSHIGILEKARNENDNIIMILEDDIEFSVNFRSDLNKYYEEVPDNWDIIYLGGSRLKGRKISEHVVKGVYDKNINGNYNMGMYGVLLNKKCINKVLKLVYPIKNPIDTIVAKNNKNLNIYFLNPSIIHHNNNFISDIHYVNNQRIHTYNNTITNTKIKIVGDENSLFSIPLFYINLDEDIERNKYMERILDRLNIDTTRIEGIYGKTYNKNYIEVNNKKYNFVINTKKKPNMGQIGTCLSHIKAIISMKDRGSDYGIICEDDLDFILLNKFKEIIKLEKIIKNAPNNWEMIKLHSSNPQVLNKLSDEFYNNNKLYSKINALGVFNYSMMAYLINKKYISSFLKKYYINGVFTFNDDYFVSDVTLLFSEDIYNYTIPIFKSKVFISSRLSKINRYDYESNEIINQFWINLTTK